VSDSEKGIAIAHRLRDPDVEILARLLEARAGVRIKWTIIENFAQRFRLRRTKSPCTRADGNDDSYFIGSR
jgi:hypothetical protein